MSKTYKDARQKVSKKQHFFSLKRKRLNKPKNLVIYINKEIDNFDENNKGEQDGN